MKPITEDGPDELIPVEWCWFEDAAELDDWFWLLLVEFDFPFEFPEVDRLLAGRS